MREPLTRRDLLKAGALSAGVIAAGGLTSTPSAAALVRAGRPKLTHGVAAGDATASTGIVWTRADKPSQMIVEYAANPAFKGAKRVAGPALTSKTGGTGKVRLTGLKPGQDIYYRVTADADGATSEPLTGHFCTAPAGRHDVRLTWSGDVAGQGWGINPDIGGMTAFKAMADRKPDLFLHSGDAVYSDGPLEEKVTLPDGRVWRNIVTPEKTKVAETLDEFRGQFAYNFLDANVRELYSSVPVFAQWDDHEVANNWYPGESFANRDGYTETDADVLAARAFQAFHEWQPIDVKRAVDGRVYRSFRWGAHLEVFVLDMRSYKDSNDDYAAKSGHILGEKQAKWLVKALSQSTATWKVVEADLPIGLIVPDNLSPSGKGQEAVSNGLPGAPTGRETELTWVLQSIAKHRVRNVVWLTADVHYTAAHHYSPDRASIEDFDPFWEFVSGPLNAGAFGPNQLDPTFGPEAVFVKAPDRQSASPMEGFQNFGELNIDGESGALTVDLRDGTGACLWTKTLQPRR